MKTILYINPIQFGYSAGHYYYVKYLVSEFKVVYLCFDSGFDLYKIDNNHLNIIYIKYNSKNTFCKIWSYITLLISFIKTASKIKPSFIVSVYSVLSPLIGIIFRRRNCKTILDIRTLKISNNSFVRYFANLGIIFTSRLFSRCTTLTDEIRGMLFINKKKTIIVPLGSEILTQKPKLYKNFILLYIGIFEKRKIEVTIDAFALFLKRQNPQFSHYYIIGSGKANEEEIISEHVRLHGLEGSVTLLGWLSHLEARKYFEISTIGLSYVPVNKYYNHQPPTKIYEYVISGLICISTNTLVASRLINSDNGVISDDDCESLSRAMEKVYVNMNKYEYSKIQSTLMDHHWERIVKDIMILNVFI